MSSVAMKHFPPNPLKSMLYKKLKLSLKYRPEILNLILKMRLCISRRNKIIKSLKHKLKGCKEAQSNIVTKDSYAQTEFESKLITEGLLEEELPVDNKSIADTKNSEETQTKEDLGWAVNDIEGTKSIADQVKEVAQSAMHESGMVYVESAGMYYDYKTGYYYNSELGLYYHTDTGCYYCYSDDKKTFVFHSYPAKSSENASLEAHIRKKYKKRQKGEEPKAKRKKRSHKKKEKTHDTTKTEIEDCKDNGEDDKPELEDGECSDTSESGGEDTNDDEAGTSTASDDDSVSRHHPPCMRMIVRETSLTKLKVGTLFLITKDGGTVGREGEHHSIILRDPNVSRNHLDIKYDQDRGGYFAVDLGSKNGSILNGVRMSPSQCTSTPLEIVHGSMLQLGETKLLCHIHPGTDTCGHCEPGLIMETQEKEKKLAYTRTCSVQMQHQLELARLKNKYAPKLLEIDQIAYNDRAQARREKVGSSHSSEKTHSTDVNTFIEPENKGFKLLEKMGWSKGEGLGKDNQGETEPIPLISNEGKSGIGAPPTLKLPKGKLGPATLRLAARTKMLHPPAKEFQAEYEDDT